MPKVVVMSKYKFVRLCNLQLEATNLENVSSIF